jgi:hypothetical protein
MLQINLIWSIFFAALLALTFTLSGCGGSKDDVTTTDPVTVTTTPAPTITPTTTPAPEVNNYVQYQDTTLVVFGKNYIRVAQDPRVRFVGEQIIVQGFDGKDVEFSSLLELLSLEVISPTGTGSFLVKVPNGFEEQWARALSDQASVRYAETNGIQTNQ